MIKIIYENDIINDNSLTDLQKRKKIKNYMQELGYRSSYHLNEILNFMRYDTNYFHIETDSIVMAEKKNLLPYRFDIAAVQRKTKIWFLKPIDTFQFFLAFNTWCDENITKMKYSKKFWDTLKKHECQYTRQSIRTYDDYKYIDWKYWPIRMKNEAIEKFISTINSYEEFMAKKLKVEDIHVRTVIRNLSKHQGKNALKLDICRQYLPYYVSDEVINKNIDKLLREFNNKGK